MLFSRLKMKYKYSLSPFGLIFDIKQSKSLNAREAPPMGLPAVVDFFPTPSSSMWISEMKRGENDENSFGLRPCRLSEPRAEGSSDAAARREMQVHVAPQGEQAHTQRQLKELVTAQKL